MYSLLIFVPCNTFMFVPLSLCFIYFVAGIISKREDSNLVNQN